METELAAGGLPCRIYTSEVTLTSVNGEEPLLSASPLLLKNRI